MTPGLLCLLPPMLFWALGQLFWALGQLSWGLCCKGHPGKGIMSVPMSSPCHPQEGRLILPVQLLAWRGCTVTSRK